MERFPCRYVPGGYWGLGTVINSPIGDADITYLFGAIDNLHPGPQGHSGVDLAAAYGDPILALLDGVVYARGFDVSSAGHWVITKHGDTVLMHAHLREPTPFNWGDSFGAGAVLGYVGLSGLTTGPHLHWGMANVNENPYLRLGGKLYNPLEHFVLPAITHVDLISYLAGGGVYFDDGESPILAGSRVVKIYYPTNDTVAPGPSTTT